jgi:hypothetical protein
MAVSTLSRLTLFYNCLLKGEFFILKISDLLLSINKEEGKGRKGGKEQIMYHELYFHLASYQDALQCDQHHSS